MENWYKYRDDLWKKVTIYNPKTYIEPQRFDHEKNDCKTSDNIRRSQRMIEAYALCNDWSFFVTCTLDPKKYDRTDLDKFRSDFMQFVRDMRKKYSCSFHAVFVPELHKSLDGWHMHGLVSGLPLDALRAFTLRERLPKYIRDKVSKGESVFDFPDYRKKFGWVDVEPVKQRDAAARYITKYITKEQGTVTAKHIDLQKHLYYVTRGLQLPEKVESPPGCYPEGLPEDFLCENFYEFEYGAVHWYSPSDK